MRAVPSFQLPQRLEPCAKLFDEERRLLPPREVPALVEFVVMDEVGIPSLCPTPRRLRDLKASAMARFDY